MQLTAPKFDDAEIDQLRDCLNSGWVTQGPMTQKFEELIAKRHGVKHALATTSCTAALHLATMALDLRPGDEVVVPAFTWVTSAHCAEYVGAKATFADIDLATFNLDPAAFEAAITPKTRAVIAVHLFGLAAPMNEIREIASRRGIAIVEDAACAIGTSYRGQPVGGLGDIGCFSFHPRKVVTTGEGGAVTTNNDAIAAIVGSVRNHGAGGPRIIDDEGAGPWTMASYDRLGYNLRLSDIQAAVGVAQMGKLDALLEERRGLAAAYRKRLSGISDIVLPTEDAGHSYQSFVIRISDGGRKRRNAVMAAMAERRIQTRPGTHAVPALGYYREKYGIDPGQFPNAVRAEDTTITLPLFPGMKMSDIDLVVETLSKALASL
ncbi:DegT/DnrJ/EryC1/StrS family aminotransferase [Bradyrhizobium sp. INPA01-394B]|uniref:DegT/DnrJ/EryC1/StrS family aminotransferase n=2 Tax=Bradyrhizobium campsiandrae TaxID=1729892 RepID=A0ABR7U924_9BRAD|nr:DegT/DnrJ/EryC1/StrS family aminotransferase [Bradyrhizobium campsiandrae]MBC9980485.1 DegT/DnrJ/EryC1/StrS family aminotransferase [Bradyrhizobium campsiandrae]